MGRASRMSPVQLADAIARERAGRPDPSVMTDEERRAAGLMDLGQAAEHEHLASLPVTRLAERVRGPVPADPWATPGPDAFEAWQASVWAAWEKAGHYERGHDGWLDDVNGNVICATCLEAVPVPAGGAFDAA